MILYIYGGGHMVIRHEKRFYVQCIYSFFVIGMILLGVLLASRSVIATDEPSDWSWTNSPTVASATSVEDVSSQYCHGAYSLENITGESSSRWMCTQKGAHVTVGMDATRYPYITTVKFTQDSQMFPVHGTVSCEIHGGCIYIPETDTLVTKQNYINNIVRSLVVYKNFSQRLTQIKDNYGQTSSYSFDSSKPDYIFKSSDGHTWPVEGLGASNNGKWLAVEFRERGFGILNMDTFQMKRFSTTQLSYGTGRDPLIELAITNSGSHVAIAGGNYGMVTTFDSNVSCNDTADGRNMEFILPMAHPCNEENINSTGFISRFANAYNPEFNDEGTELDFYAKSYTEKPKVVTLTTHGYTVPRLDYLALGDSFTSGEGEINDSSYQSGTNDEFEKCHLSARSYPYVIATLLGIEAQYVHSVACSGAKTSDVIGEDAGYWGQGARLDNDKLDLTKTARVLYQKQSIEAFNPGRVHQIAFVSKYKPRIITIGIGGNDVGLMEKLRTCVGLDSCEWANTAEGREKTALEIKAAFDTLVTTYTAIHNASPRSKIYAVGYPKVIDAEGQCTFFDGTLLNTAERKFMNEAVQYINQIVSAAAERVGIPYIDIESSFGDKVLCGSTQPSVMNAIRVGDDSTISANIKWLKLIGNESFHPRPSGHAIIATAIFGQRPDLLSSHYCPELGPLVATVCANSLINAPSPPAYWLSDGVTHNYPSQHISDFVQNSPDPADISHKILATASYTFVPGSQVRAEIHSSSTVIGTTTADTTGAVTLSVELPSELIEGFHTIHLYGTSYSGQAVDLYQVIKYVLPSLDIDTPVVSLDGSPESNTGEIDSSTVAKDSQALNETREDDSYRQNQTVATVSNSVRTNEATATLQPAKTGDGASLADTKTKQEGFNLLIFLVPAIIWLVFGIGLEIRSRMKS